MLEPDVVRFRLLYFLANDGFDEVSSYLNVICLFRDAISLKNWFACEKYATPKLESYEVKVSSSVNR